LRQVYGLFLSEWSTQCDLVLRLKCQYVPFSVTSSYCCLSFRTFVLRSIFLSTSLFRRQFLHRMCPIQLAFLGVFVCRTSLSFLTVCSTFLFLNSGVKISSASFSSSYFQNFKIFLIYFPKCRSFGTIQRNAPKCNISLASS
jgi:hypothetical protein